MKNLHIENSYKVWSTRKMKKNIIHATYKQHKNCFAENVLNRTYTSMYVEWWLHNIGYYLTLPLIKNKKMKADEIIKMLESMKGQIQRIRNEELSVKTAEEGIEACITKS